MSMIWTIVLFDGYDWRRYGDDDYVTEAGARRDAADLARQFPNHTFRVRKAGRAFLHRLA